MIRLAFRQRITALALAAALLAPCWVSAAAPPSARQQPAQPGLFGQIWIGLTALWGSPVTPDAGCWLDPNGRCAPGTAGTRAPVTPDEGCRADPNGRCLTGG
jgi:hypothetical protein